MTEKEELLQEMARCVLEMEDELVVDVAKRYAEKGYDPAEGILTGLVSGMNQAAELYEKEEYFIPELLICSSAMYNALDVLRPLMPKEENGVKRKVVIGVVEGDTHDIGKNLVKVMLCTVSDIYDENERYNDAREILFIAYDRAPSSRKIIFGLAELAIKIGDLDEAADCYNEFVSVAPKDGNQYVLKYELSKAKNEPIEKQIEALEEFKQVEYIERWAFELAKLYEKAGMIEGLGQIHAAEPLLTYGKYRELYLTNRQYAYARQDDKEAVITALNCDDQEAELVIPFSVSGRKIVDLLGNGNYTVSDDKINVFMGVWAGL